MHASLPETAHTAASPAVSVDELWPDAIDEPMFAQAALRNVSALFELPMAIMQIESGGSAWYEYGVTGRQLGADFLQATLSRFAAEPEPGARAAFLNDAAGLWRAPDGVLPGVDARVRFCARMPLASPGGIATGTLWLLDTRVRPELVALQGAQLADAATQVAGYFQALHAVRYRDRLTHLANRTQFVRDVLACMSLRGASGAAYHAVMVDVGSLSMISRMVVALGLAKVERSIQSMTRRLIAFLPSDIRLYKLGHARFGFLLADAPDAVQALALRCTACFDQPLAVEDDLPIAMTAHAGVVHLDEVDSAADVMSALFAISEQARIQCKPLLVYDRGLAEAQQRAFAIVHSLPAALAAPDQLRLVYQPRERLADGAWVSAEALIRWRHPRFGELAPGEFLPLIEGTLLMPRLTEWVVNAATRQLAEWNRRMPDFHVSINVAPSDFSQADMVDVLCAALERHGANGANVELEITETSVGSDPDHARRVLQRLKQAGISVAIDDFGVGHSSLSRWTSFSFGTLKLDRSLIRNVVEDPHAEAIFKWVVSLAKTLGQKVVAEGVETAAQQWAAARWGCDEAQGFLISRPLEADVMSARLTEARHRSVDDLPVERRLRGSRGRYSRQNLAELRRLIFVYLGWS